MAESKSILDQFVTDVMKLEHCKGCGRLTESRCSGRTSLGSYRGESYIWRVEAVCNAPLCEECEGCDYETSWLNTVANRIRRFFGLPEKTKHGHRQKLPKCC